MATDRTMPTTAATPSRKSWLERKLPPSLNPVKAREQALDAVTRADEPALAAAGTALQVAREYPGLDVEVDAPSAFQAETRARAEASWRVTGNWLLVAVFASLIILAVSFFTGDTSTFGGDYAPYFSALIWLLVVPWVLCQIMRLVMIAPWGRSKVRVGSQSGAKHAP